MAFDAAIALALAEQAAATLELDARGLRIMRERIGITIELPACAAIVRVTPPRRTPIARRMVAMAQAFARCGAPTVRLLCANQQPLIDARGTVTVWERIVGPTIDEHAYAQIGALTRAVHDASRGRTNEPELPRFEPCGELDMMLAALAEDGYPPARLEALRARRDLLDQRWRELPDASLGEVFVHGDVHHENVLVGDAGLRFVDLELSSVGPACLDLAPLAAAVNRYGAPPRRLDEFVRGYGVDLRDSEPFELCRDTYELVSAVWAARCRRQSPRLAREAELRVGTLLDAGQDGTWTLL